jgi:hypothetical protein
LDGDDLGAVDAYFDGFACYCNTAIVCHIS